MPVPFGAGQPTRKSQAGDEGAAAFWSAVTRAAGEEGHIGR